jgi:alpha-tubulin suppressor-like RCC1 family protein
VVKGWQLRSSFMPASLRVTLRVSVLICGALVSTAPVAGATVLPARAAPHELAAGLAGDGFGFCAMLKSGGAECWGSNLSGALGSGGNESQSDVPVAVKGVSEVAGLVTDGSGWCALLHGGTAKCWGSNSQGALGGGDASVAQSAVPLTVKDVAGATAVVGGYNGYCALLATGGAKCWGDNFEGSLGNGGSEAFSSTPLTVKGLTGAVALTFSGGYGYCALLSNGHAKCWGGNSNGVLGDGGAQISADAPVTVKGLLGADSLVSDGRGYCALLQNGGVKCWGSDGDGVSGALGDGASEAQSNVPVTVKGLRTATSLVSNGHGYCALLKSGVAKCWGSNFGGTLGDGGGEAQSNVPVTVKGLSGVASLVSDGRGYCAVSKAGGAMCWGDNPDGELGNGMSDATSDIPVTVKGLSSVTSLVGGGDGYCALLKNAGADCWGDNFEGALGSGTGQGYSDVPVVVAGLGK